MYKETKQLLKELKENVDSVYRFEEDGNKYGLLIISRGDLLFYQENEKALVCEISARYSLIAPETIKEWDNSHKITAEERPAILEKIQHFFKKAYQNDLKVFSEKG